MHFLATTAVALAGCAQALPSSVKHVLHERRDVVPESWQHKYKADSTAQVPVRIGLTQSNLDRGHDLLMEVSEHSSPRYGKYYTQEEIHDLFAPSEESASTVRGWLESSGISADRISQSVNKQWIQFDAFIAELEDLVKAKYNVYTHEDGKSHTACDEYHLPEHVQAHVDYITPGVKLFHPRSIAKRQDDSSENGQGKNYKLPTLRKPLPMSMGDVKAKSKNGDLSSCDIVASPECIKAMYNITIGKLSDSSNQMGIFEDLNDHYSQQDLNSFFEYAYPIIPQGTHPKLEGIDGAIGPVAVQNAGIESALDFQISYPIIWPQQSILFQTDDQATETNYTYPGFLNNFLDALDGSYCDNSPLDPPYPDPRKNGYKGQLQCGVYKPTNVISISYGGQEPDLPVYYQKRQCNEFMKLGMQGVSVMISSGDSGVAGVATKNSNGCLGKQENQFNPDFPANCPYVTTLGATFLPKGANVKKDEEIAVTRFPSGGGFSNIYPAPSYQKAAVNAFLSKYPPPYNSYETTNSRKPGGLLGRFNSIGRGYPDFSAIGDNVLFFGQGTIGLVGGTSASAPTFGAIINRINEELIAAGKPTVGFVNPVLYAHPEVLHDITTGSNPGCNSQGFSCAPGWDPVTGLGTPNYPAMLKLFMSL